MLFDLARGLYAVDAGHTDIQHGYIGVLLARVADGLLSIAGFRHHLHVVLGLQYLTSSLANYRMVIGQKNSDRLSCHRNTSLLTTAVLIIAA